MANPICTLQNLSLTYPHKLIFKDVTFTLNEGDKIGVLGLNGHGKSSLFKVMMGVQSPDTTVPSFLFDRTRDFSIFYVPQELPGLGDQSPSDYFYEFYPEFKILKDRLDEIAHALTNQTVLNGIYDQILEQQEQIFSELHRQGADLCHAQYINYLKSFGFVEVEGAIAGAVKNLSGGEQRKMALALGLSCPHQVVLWDEPTNHLDLETIYKFEEELQACKKTFMIISHDRGLLNNVVDRILHIQNGKLKSFQGTYADYLVFLREEQLAREKELDRLSNQKRRETAWILRGARARRTKSKKRIEDYGTLNKVIEDLKAESHKQVSLNLQSSGRKTKALVTATDFGLSLGGKELLRGINFKICKGDKIALMGANGCGKSSLLKLILGELDLSAGVGVGEIKGELKKAEDLNAGLFSQKREHLPENMTPWEMIGDGNDFVISNTGSSRHVVGYLEGFLFDAEEIKRPIFTFSGGEKNRLQLAQFMKTAKDLWIFDEPTNDLDLETIGILEDELQNYEGALLVVCHDRTFIENVSNKCWVIHDKGLEIFEGGWSQAELFLEALELEKELKLKNDKSSKNDKSDKKREQDLKFTQKDRLRLENLTREMEEMESIIVDIEALLAAIDYQQDKDAVTKASELNAKLYTAKEKLEKLFTEWADLEERSESGQRN